MKKFFFKMTSLSAGWLDVLTSNYDTILYTEDVIVKHLHTVRGSLKLVAGNRFSNLKYSLTCAVYATATVTTVPVKIGI